MAGRTTTFDVYAIGETARLSFLTFLLFFSSRLLLSRPLLMVGRILSWGRIRRRCQQFRANPVAAPAEPPRLHWWTVLGPIQGPLRPLRFPLPVFIDGVLSTANKVQAGEIGADLEHLCLIGRE